MIIKINVLILLRIYNDEINENNDKFKKMNHTIIYYYYFMVQLH